MVHIVTSENWRCAGAGQPAAAAMRTTCSVLDIPPMYMMSGWTMSTARIAIMRSQVARSQSCSPPVTSTASASVTCLVCSSFQYGQGSS
jgi:hypothetical protein